MLEPAVLEDHQLARVQLLQEHLIADFVGARLLIAFIEIGLGAATLAVQDIEDNKLFLVLMWLRHDIGVCPEQIDPECASLLPPVFRHEAEKCLDEVLGLRVIKQLDTLVDTFTLNFGAIPDGYGLIFFEGQFAVVPLVQDDVSRPLAVMWPVTFVLSELATVEVGSPKGSSRTCQGALYPIRWSERSRASLRRRELCVAPKMRSKLIYRPFMHSLG